MRKRATDGKLLPIHGMTGSREYRTWCHMRNRCSDDSHKYWHRYGGRGIRVCEEWKTSFSTFFKDMGTCPNGCSLDRIDNDGDYEPRNCRWATPRQQRVNCARVRMFSHGGKTQTIKDWCKDLSLKTSTVYNRINIHKWPIAEALGIVGHIEKPRTTIGIKNGMVRHPERSFFVTNNPARKLTPSKVIEIRCRHAIGDSCRKIGRELRVSATNVRDIVRRRIWKHIP